MKGTQLPAAAPGPPLRSAEVLSGCPGPMRQEPSCKENAARERQTKLILESQERKLIIDIASAPMRAEPKWLKVGENFAEKEEVKVIWLQTVARLCFRKCRVRNESRESWSGGQDFPQINRNSTDDETLSFRSCWHYS